MTGLRLLRWETFPARRSWSVDARRRRAGLAVFPDSVEHLDRARRHGAGGDRRAADDADHHHRRDRHLGRLDDRAVRRRRWRSASSRACRSKRRWSRASWSARWPAWSTAPSSSAIGPAFAGRHHRHAGALSRHRADHPQGARRQRFPDWYQEIGFGTIPRHADPVERAAVPAAASRGSPSSCTARAGAGRIYAIGNNQRGRRHIPASNVKRAMLGVFVASGTMSAIAAIVLTAYLASARSDTAIGLELPVITAVVLGGVNIFGGSGSLVGVLLALLVLAFVQEHARPHRHDAGAAGDRHRRGAGRHAGGVRRLAQSARPQRLFRAAPGR